jgi:3-methyladenine DNA glycosylase/8-oxoguanine DNA glycosylase
VPLSFDLSIAEAHIRTADPKLAAMIDLHGPCRIDPDGLMSPFAALVRSIAYQQLTGKAAATIHGRVLTLYRPRRHPRPEDVLATADDRLRGAGLSRAKILAVKDLAAKTLDGTVPTIARLKRLDDEEIVERLSSVRGVGRWTVEMLLIFRLGRPGRASGDRLWREKRIPADVPDARSAVAGAGAEARRAVASVSEHRELVPLALAGEAARRHLSRP